MSSLTVRTLIKDFLAAQLPGENLIDLSDDVGDFQDLVEEAGLVYTVDPWLGIDFVGFDEYPVDILATNNTGCYREEGTVMLYVVEPMNTATPPSPREKILLVFFVSSSYKTPDYKYRLSFNLCTHCNLISIVITGFTIAMIDPWANSKLSPLISFITFLLSSEFRNPTRSA